MFYVLLFLVATAVMAVILRPLWVDLAPIAENEDISVYKAQLKEVESDLEKGVLSAADAETARIEISRRLLAADKRSSDQTARSGKAMRGLALGAGLVLIGASLALYFQFGRPDLPDQPLLARLEAMQIAREARPSQIEVEAEITPADRKIDPAYAELLEKLRAAVAERPDDLQGLRLLAYHEANTGNFIAGHQAQEKVVTLLGEDAKADDYERWGEYLVLAANGYVSPKAEDALRNALALDPSLSRARYFSGLFMAQTGRPDVAIRIWDALLAEGPEEAPWVGAIRSDYNRVAALAGAEPLAGPSAEEIEAAADLSAEDRAAMIEGMVSGLAERLGSEGGTPAEWAQLIRALGVLERVGEADQIYKEARDVFASDGAALNVITRAAQDAGVLQ